MSHATRTLVFFSALVVAPAGYTVDAVTPGLETDLKLRLGGFFEGERDLGTTGLLDTTNEGYADAQGSLYWQPGQNWATYLRVQGFAPTGELVVNDEERPRRSESYAALRELWFEYKGFTSYPGEVLRLGLQRLREPDGQWFDRDVESVRWIFDTTLLQGQIGVAESFLTYRSDGSEPPASQRDRAYGFAGLGGQWRAGHFLGIRAAHAIDHVDPEEEFADANEKDPKLAKRRFTWIDLYAHNGYYEEATKPGLSYWLDAGILAGDREDLVVSADPLVLPQIEERDVMGWAGDVGLRWRLPTTTPVQLGAAFAYGSGRKTGEDKDHRYEQTGLHSNRSRFTGTRSQVYRYNEALQADLSNLAVGTAYLSVPLDRFDASLVYSRFMRDRDDQGVITDGIDLQPEPGERELGDGVDAVLAYYFGTPKLAAAVAKEDDDVRSNIRLRGSMFKPGDAYAENADDQYRVTLEMTLWF